MARKQPANYEIFEGHAVRGLLKTQGMGYEEFNQQCADIIENAKQSGYQKQLATMRALAEGSLFYYCVTVLGLTYINNQFGYRLCVDVQQNKWNRLWIIAREHFKSTIITCASTLWELTRDPNKTFCIYSYKTDMAQTFLKQIKGWCEVGSSKDMLLLLWPDIFWENPMDCAFRKPDGTRVTWTWNSDKIEVKRKRRSKEMSIEIGGIEGSSRTGGHFSHQIFDDAETPATVQTVESIMKCYATLKNTFNSGQTDNMNFAFIGTFYARDDVYVKLIKDGIFKESVIQSCYDYDGNPIRFTMEEIEFKKKLLGSSNFATQMLCDPSLMSSSSFQPEWVQWWTPSKTEGLNIYCFVDPAGNKQGKRHDYTVMIVVGIDSLSHMMILDVYRDKMTFADKFRNLLAIQRRWKPIFTFYEEVSMQDDIGSLYREMDNQGSHFTITAFHPNRKGDKESRIEKLIDWFSRRDVWWCEYSIHRNWQGEDENMAKTAYRDEYLCYPDLSHDDFLDCLSQVVIAITDQSIQAPMDARKSNDDEYYEDDEQFDPYQFSVGRATGRSTFSRSIR